MRIFNSLFSLFILSIYSLTCSSQTKNINDNFNANWKFHLGGLEFAETTDYNDKNWENVNIPHTWNATDPFDDDLTYIRGIAWYRKTFTVNTSDTSKVTTINFDGVFQVADVYVNGAFLGRHKGGYTAFEFDISRHLKIGKNTIAVKVNNAQDQFIPPLSIGYAGYGGIYRPVELVSTHKVHFNNNSYASGKIKINTPEVSDKNAFIVIESNVKNELNITQSAKIVQQIFNSKNQLIQTLEKDIKIDAGKSSKINFETNIDNPSLWSPETPNLYTVESIIKIENKVVDVVKNPLGLRWFSFSPNDGFSLNGKKYILKGTNRHQDMQGKGDALSAIDHLNDLKMIKNMGCNFVRLAHYPQSQDILNIADSLGLFIWEETPVVNYMNIHPEFLANCENMIREMISQGYNHPSIIIWGSMNEILLWSSTGERIQNHDHEKDYVKKVQHYSVKLDSVVRKEDPSRYNAIAMHMSKEYDEFNLSNIPKISAYNVYNGWYNGKVEEFGAALKKKHIENPNKILFISEYGAEADPRINTSAPLRLDFSGQYQRMFLESYLRQSREMPWLAGTAIWNQFDFSQPNVGGTIPNLNQKGVLNWDRTTKDSYYLFKANWNKEPMIYIASRDWKFRTGNLNEKSTIEIYSNLEEVSIYLNGAKVATRKPDDIQKVTFQCLLKQGNNLIKVTGYNGKNLILDSLTINYQPKFITGTNFESVNLNIGSKTQYIDASGKIWIEDQPYKKGSFGYIDGENITINLKKVIGKTNDVPLYYSSLENLKSYILDIPDGKYQISLGFVEPENLTVGERIFDVVANDMAIITNLDLTAESINTQAIQKTFLVTIKDNQGLTLNFKPIKGKTILSSLSVSKLPNKEVIISNKAN